MVTKSKWLGIVALAGVVIIGSSARRAEAQQNAQPAQQPPPQGNRFFRVLPGETVNDAARNAAITAQAYAAEDAYKDSPNPFNVTNISGNPGGPAPASSGGGYGGSYGAYSNPYMGSGYGGSYGGYFDGGAGVLNASANIMDSQGRLMISNQQAVLLQEAVKRERLRNKRRVFDEWLYEKANTPTLEQMRQDERALQLSRARNDPPVTEIYSGYSLNRLLDNLIKLQGVEGRPVPISEDVLKQINVTSASNGANIGVLKDRGKLSWPTALVDLPPEDKTRELRNQLQSLVLEAMDQASKGRVQATIIQGMRGDIDALRAYLKRNAFDLSFPLYSEASRYLNDLDSAVRVLERPDASKFVNGTFSLDSKKIKTVPDLIRFMKDNGLTFAPSGPGDEAAYVALQRAMANYDVNTQALVSTQRPPKQ